MSELDPKHQFAKTLFEFFPDFIPTQALYLDLEGRQYGSEDILSLYWPYLGGTERFSWLKRSDSSAINFADLHNCLRSIGAAAAKWIVVFSGGQESPDERDRLIDLLGLDPFPDSDWINLHLVLRRCRDIRRSIREHRYVWHSRDQSRVRYSLEALEWEFDIHRSVRIRSHGNNYQDLDGAAGSMEVLSAAQKSILGMATREEEESFQAYCEADVKNMYLISRTCEQLLFSRIEQTARRR